MLLVGVSTVIYKITSIQGQILSTIDKVSDINFARFAELDAKLRIHIAECTAKEKHINACLRELKLRTELKEDGRN